MTPRYAKVSEITEKIRVSADAVYLWIRQGKIPADCIVSYRGDGPGRQRTIRASAQIWRAVPSSRPTKCESNRYRGISSGVRQLHNDQVGSPFRTSVDF